MVKAVVVLIFLSSVVLANAVEYYNSALNAYVQGDYKRALEWFETALRLEPKIESYDPLVKLKMGVCAFMINDHAKAKAYLEQYESNNAVAASILKVIREGKKVTEEWMVWLRSRIPTSPPIQTQTSQKRAPVLLILGVFTASFSVTFLVIKILMRKKKSLEERELTVEEKLERQLEEIGMVSKSVEQGARTVDFETDEELQKLEAQIDNIVREIISKEGEKKENEIIVGEDPFDILKRMEEKEKYSEEDAKLLSQIMQQLVNTPTDKPSETDEQDRS
ncbi:tetratricopeptide repeat protein [Pseudothermotoga sp.]|nr:tetratricopeptide repeat protein [Pseudothermotoga sp.]MDW8138858.1 tetratricopeptide repeat protein [Pseudothermotoga sp.]